MMTLRTAIGLTQAGLADLVCVSRQTVVGWEAGSSYPKPHHLKQLIALSLQQQTFTPGQEAEEIRTFWKAAHQKVLFDEHWLAERLNSPHTPAEPGMAQRIANTGMDKLSLAQPADAAKVYGSDLLSAPNLYGREQERAILSQWILEERCKVVSVLGIGGIGKSALAVSLMYQVADHFEGVIWRTLRDAPPLNAFLEDFLQVLAPQPLTVYPPTERVSSACC